jgi:PAS domain-containing protein
LKQFRGYVVIATVILALYAALALWLDRQATRQHENTFNDEQALQMQLSAQSIADHFRWLSGEMTFAATCIIPQYLSGDTSLNTTDAIISAAVDNRLPIEGLAVGFFATPDIPLLVHAQPGADGELATSLLEDWVRTYWDTAKAKDRYFVTPFYVTDEYQLYGLLVPVYGGDQFEGMVGTTLDFGPVLERYIVPIRSGKYGAAWVQDANSLVIYDHEAETIGQYVTEIAQPFPDLARLNQRLMTEDEGQGEYHYTVEPGGEVARKLVAWSTVYLGDQRLTLALSAPDTEVSAGLAITREPTVLLGILLGVTLVASGGLFYFFQQRTLQNEVLARTQELEQLTATLEQRITRRTAQLEQERAQLKTILEAMDEGLLYRQGQQIMYANPSLTRSRSMTMGRPLSRVS